MKWLPPMAKASPSPVTIHTLRSGRASLRPEATVVPRPWMVWKP